MNALRRCVVVCHKHRKKFSLVSTLTRTASKVNYDTYTEGLHHACLLVCMYICFIKVGKNGLELFYSYMLLYLRLVSRFKYMNLINNVLKISEFI